MVDEAEAVLAGATPEVWAHYDGTDGRVPESERWIVHVPRGSGLERSHLVSAVRAALAASRESQTEETARGYEPCVIDSEGRCTRWSHEHHHEVTW
jgi:hypothetical protein